MSSTIKNKSYLNIILVVGVSWQDYCLYFTHPLVFERFYSVKFNVYTYNT